MRPGFFIFFNKSLGGVKKTPMRDRAVWRDSDERIEKELKPDWIDRQEVKELKKLKQHKPDIFNVIEEINRQTGGKYKDFLSGIELGAALSPELAAQPWKTLLQSLLEMDLDVLAKTGEAAEAKIEPRLTPKEIIQKARRFTGAQKAVKIVLSKMANNYLEYWKPADEYYTSEYHSYYKYDD